MKSRDILTGLMRFADFGHDLVKVHRRGVDDLCAFGAMAQDFVRYQRAGIETDGAGRDDVTAP